MADTMNPTSTPRHIAAEKCRPDEIDVCTGWVDDRRPTLRPGHKLYPLFAWAWEQQDTWTLEEHRTFWEATIALWPGHDDRRGSAELKGWALYAARRRGLSDADAESLFFYSPGTLARKGAIAHADAVEGFAVTDYVLPRIYAGHEPAPNADAFPNLVEPARDDPRARELQAALDSIPE